MLAGKPANRKEVLFQERTVRQTRMNVTRIRVKTELRAMTSWTGTRVHAQMDTKVLAPVMITRHILV